MRTAFKTLALASIALISLNACQKEENGKNNPAEEVSGTYTGYSKSEFQYSPTPMYSDGETISVTKLADAAVSVDFESDSWGILVIPEASVSEKDGKYILTGEGTATMGMGNETSDYPCSLTASVSNGSDFIFEFSVPSVMGGLDITVLPGSIPSEIKVSGTYVGNVGMSVSGSDMGTTEMTVTLSAEAGKASIITSSFEAMEGAMTMPAITIDAEMTEKDGTFHFTQDNIDVTADEMHITGSMEGTITEDGTASLKYVITPGAMPMAVTLDFNGKKQE